MKKLFWSTVTALSLTACVTLQKNEDLASELETKIANTWAVKVKSEDYDALARIEKTLRKMPKVDSCKISLLDPDEFEACVESFGKNIAGVYFPPRSVCGEKILLPTSASEETITHEFAHKRTYELGIEFIERWNKTHDYEYGVGFKRDEKGRYLWEEDTWEMRDGFCTPYSRININEDIATLTVFIRHQLPVNLVFSTSKESAKILAKKVELLKEGEFITAQEEYTCKCALKGYSRR